MFLQHIHQKTCQRANVPFRFLVLRNEMTGKWMYLYIYYIII